MTSIYKYIEIFTNAYKYIQMYTNICKYMYKFIQIYRRGAELSWLRMHDKEGAIVASSCCMTTTAGSDCAALLAPAYVDLHIGAYRRQCSNACKDTNVIQDSSALGICAHWRCRRKIQKFAVHAVLLSRVSIGKQGVPPGGCSPSRDTLSLQGQEYSGGELGVKHWQSKKKRKLPT